MTRGPDGRWTALDARRLYTHARTGGFLYQAKLRLELTRRLGVEWTPVRNGVAEIDGIPAAVRRSFSRRRAEIEAELEQRGEHTPGAAQVAALHTRRDKDYAVPAGELRERWRDRARQLDLTPEHIDALAGQTEVTPLTPTAAQQGHDHLASPAGLTHRQSSFTRRDAVRAWCEQLHHGGDVHEIEALADDLLAGQAVVPLLPDASTPTVGDVVRRADGRIVAAGTEERRYSTPELLALEAEILETARDGRGRNRGSVRRPVADAVLTSRPELSDEQHEMVSRLLRDGDAIAVVVGRAGTGKTYALDGARQGWQAEGYQVSRRGESHPPALVEPGVNLSAHRAPIVQPSGRTPSRQCANRPGWRLATSAMNLRALVRWRRSRLYFFMAHLTRISLRWRKTGYNMDL